MERLFQNVLAMSLSAGFLAAVVIGLRWCFRKSPKWVHCALWALVAVRLMLPALPQSEYSMVPQRVSDPEVIVGFVAEIPQFVPPAPVQEEAPAPMAQAPKVPAPPLLVSEPAPAASSVDWMVILAWVWLLGATLMGTYGAFSYLRIRRQVAASVDIGNRVLLCDYIDTPFILGLVRPRIYLPSQLDSKTASYVLAHEQAHLQRRDHWWKPFGFLLLSIHWFNPMIWAAYCLLCRDIEMACDEAVIRTMDQDEKMGYSGALLRCSIPRKLVSICPLAFGEVSVKERIKSVLHYRRPALWLTIGGVAAVGAAAVFFLTDPAGPQGEVAYYPTAHYNSSSDYLELTEYDKDFREIRREQYLGGVFQHSAETDYQKIGNDRLRTVVYKVDRDSQHILNPEGDLEIHPGQSATLIYREELDEEGSVTYSACLTTGTVTQWLPTYDDQGNLTSERNLWGDGSSLYTYTYDDNGNVATKRSQVNRNKFSLPSDREDKFRYDEQGNVISYQRYIGGKLECQELSVWNDNGKRRSMVQSWAGEPDSLYSYSYDETGLVETCEVSWPDGTVYKTYITTYDQHGNVLSQIYRENGVEFRSYSNYIGSDGSRSIGIPKEIYTEGKAVGPYTSPAQEPNPTMILEAHDVTPAGAILKVKVSPRLQSSDLTIGNRFTLERKNGEKWEELEPLDRNFVNWTPQEVGELPIVGGYYVTDYHVSWGRLYGILPPGDYRLNTTLSGYYTSDCSAEFTIEANGHEVGEKQLQQCMDALDQLVNSQHYLVEIVDDLGHRELHAQYSNHWLHLTYSSPTASIPESGQLMMGGRRFIWMDGTWAINERAPESALTDWFEEFVFDHQDLNLLRGSTDWGVPFQVDDRPGKELSQKDHFVTFFLDKQGLLTEIREEGVITQYNGQAVETPYSRTLKVLTTDLKELEDLLLNSQGEMLYGSFSWENDKKDTVGGQYISGGRYINSESRHTFDDPMRSKYAVYNLAQKELWPGLAVQYGIVSRDEQAKMWRVEFRYVGGSGGYVYLNDQGITQWVKMTYPAHLTPDQADAALRKCWSVINQVQTQGSYGMETTFAYNNRNGTGEHTIQSWVRETDWLEVIKAPVSDVQAVRMYCLGRSFENDHGWGRNYQRFFQESAGSMGQFIPWLASVPWEDYDVLLLEESRSSIHFLMRPRAELMDEYNVTFHFNDQGEFQSADIDTRCGSIVSRQTARIITLDEAQAEEQILSAYNQLANGE